MANLSVFNNLLLILSALGVTICAANLGLSVLNMFGASKRCDEECKMFLPFYSLGIGFAVIIVSIYMLSVFGAINTYSIWGLLVFQIVLLFFNRNPARYVERLFKGSYAVKKIFHSYPHKWFLLGTVFILAGYFISGLIISSIPTIEADSANTYLNAAKLFLQHHRIIDTGNIIGGMAKNGFMLMIYGMGLNSSLLAQLLLFIISFSGILHCFLLISRKINIFFAALVTLVFITMQHQTVFVVGTAKLDGVIFTYSVLALSSILYIFGEHGLSKDPHVYMNGIFVGCLMGLSYFDLTALAIYLMLLIAHIIQTKSRLKNKIALLAGWLACVMLTALPSYLYNIAEFANPFYPFYGGIFGRGLGGNIGDKSFIFPFVNEIKNSYSVHDLRTFLLLPVILFNNPVRLQAGKEYLFAGMWIAGLMALLFVGAAALLDHKKTRRYYLEPGRFKIFIIAFAGYIYFYAFWAKSQFILRYLAICFPFLLLLCAFLFQFIYSYLDLGRLRKYSGIFLLCFCGVILFNMKPLITKTTSACLSIFRGKSTDSIIEEQFKYYIDNGNTSNFGKAIIALNKQLKKGDKVLSFITGNYYFSRDAVVFSGNGSNTLPSRFGIPKPLYEFDSYGEFENTLISNGFTYMVINPGFLCLSKDEERVILSYIKNRHADSTIDDILIYRLC